MGKFNGKNLELWKQVKNVFKEVKNGLDLTNPNAKTGHIHRLWIYYYIMYQAIKNKYWNFWSLWSFVGNEIQMRHVNWSV